MNKEQTGFFDDERLNPRRAMQLTIESLMAYAPFYEHWAIAFSGGKDSSAMATIVAHLIETKQIPAPKSLTVLYADTRMELPPLQISAMKMLAEFEKRGIKTQIVLPKMDDRFMVYMLGRGVPPPTNGFRWCTAQIKVEPMLAALQSLRESTGQKLLMLTGVRIGESAARDQRIALSCGKNGAECGQGWFQETTPESIADTLAPILHWRVCHVWDWLRNEAPKLGYPTGIVAESYGGDQAAEAGVRTGCVGCNLASRDVALERILRVPGWAYLKPLTRLRPLYAELRTPKNRLRKHGEHLKDGTFVATDRMGPLTMEARRYGLEEVVAIQKAINKIKPDSHLFYSLVNGEEYSRITELIAVNTWPNRWTGEEDTGDIIRPVRFTRGGGRQMQMMIEEATHTE